MRFLVIEGLDGSGKSTQVAMLRSYFEERSVAYRYLHFPRLEHGVYGELVARFLRGEMGDNNTVDPYLVALIFAGDRNAAKEMINEWIENDILVLVDRYVYSNIAFQCAKFDAPEDQKKLAAWILELEFKDHKIPVPELNVFLDVPFEFTRSRLSRVRDGEDREYLKGGSDIHEQDLNFQAKVREMYLSLCSEQENLRIVNCSDSEGNMKSPDQVFQLLLDTLGLNNE